MAAPSASPLFPEGSWHGLSPRYIAVRRITAIAANVVVWGVLVAAALLWSPVPWLIWVILAVGIPWTTWRIWRVGRWVRSWGWAERDADLCIRHGLWFKRLVVIPFGRMQLVDVKAGPLLRWRRLASVQLVTAAVQTNAVIPGLSFEDATQLRDRLIERADTDGSGL